MTAGDKDALERANHTTLVRHMQGIPGDWLDLILAETARRCLAAAGDATGSPGADSSRVTITRYETAGVYGSESKKTCRKKYGIVSVLGLQIVLSALYTPSSIHDVVAHAVQACRV